jgi:cell division septation protein DedD
MPRGPSQKEVRAADLERADPLLMFAAEPVKPAGDTKLGNNPVPAAGQSRRVWWVGAALLLSTVAGAVGTTMYLKVMQQAEPVADPPPAPLVLTAPTLETDLPPDAAAQVARLPETTSTETLDSAVVAIVQSYQIQVASFESGRRATALVEDLRHAGYAAQSSVVEGATGRLHQVIVGPYETFREAELVVAQIHQIPGYADAIILQPEQRHPR